MKPKPKDIVSEMTDKGARKSSYEAPRIIKSWPLVVRAIGGSPPPIP